MRTSCDLHFLVLNAKVRTYIARKVVSSTYIQRQIYLYAGFCHKPSVAQDLKSEMSVLKGSSFVLVQARIEQNVTCIYSIISEQYHMQMCD